MKSYAALTKLMVISVTPMYGNPLSGPSWWYEGESSVISPNAPSGENYGVANIGQLKSLAWSAKLRMDRDYASAFGAGREINQLVSTWFSDLSYTQPLSDDSSYSPVNIGQVKAVASLFYERLSILEGPAAPTPPWTPTTSDDSNHSPVNIGQLKNVFSFSLQPTEIDSIDADGDGLNDWWEMFYYGSLSTVGIPNLSSDSDGDGLTLAMEEALGTNPNVGIETQGSSSSGIVVFVPN